MELKDTLEKALGFEWSAKGEVLPSTTISPMSGSFFVVDRDISTGMKISRLGVLVIMVTALMVLLANRKNVVRFVTSSGGESSS